MQLLEEDIKLDILLRLKSLLNTNEKAQKIDLFHVEREASLYRVIQFLTEYSERWWIVIRLCLPRETHKDIGVSTRKSKQVSTRNLFDLPLTDILRDFDSIWADQLRKHEIYIEEPSILKQLIEEDIPMMVDLFVEWVGTHEASFQKSKKALYRSLLFYVGGLQERNKLLNKSNKCILNIWRRDYGINHNAYPILHTLLVMKKLWYISIEELDFRGWYYIEILPVFLEIILLHKNLEDIVLDTLIDKKYKEIRIYEKNSQLLINRSIDIIDSNIKHTELLKAYPNSDITTKNYKWKVTKYIVTEKIKLKKSEQE